MRHILVLFQAFGILLSRVKACNYDFDLEYSGMSTCNDEVVSEHQDLDIHVPMEHSLGDELLEPASDTDHFEVVIPSKASLDAQSSNIAPKIGKTYLNIVYDSDEEEKSEEEQVKSGLEVEEDPTSLDTMQRLEESEDKAPQDVDDDPEEVEYISQDFNDDSEEEQEQNISQVENDDVEMEDSENEDSPESEEELVKGQMTGTTDNHESSSVNEEREIRIPEPLEDDDDDDEIFIPNGAAQSEFNLLKKYFTLQPDVDSKIVAKATSSPRESSETDFSLSDGEDLESCSATSASRCSSTEPQQQESSSELPDFSSGDEDETGSVVTDDSRMPLLRHNAGLVNHALNCYASSLLVGLYSIPVIQRSFYREVERASIIEVPRKDESITAAISTVFYKMSTLNSPIELRTFFAAALQETTGWQFGNIECVLEFWTLLSNVLPESITRNFQVRSQENHFRQAEENQYRPSEDLLIKSVSQVSNLIYAYPQQYASVVDLIEASFLDQNVKEYIIEPVSQHEYPQIISEPISEKLVIPSYTTCTILELPNVLFFGVPRLNWNTRSGNPICNFARLEFTPTITINSEEYTLFGNIIYDPKRVHYYAHVYDALSEEWYQHDDRKVTRLSKGSRTKKFREYLLNHLSTMVFYVKSSLIEDFKIPENWIVSEAIAAQLSSRYVPKKTTAVNDATKSSYKPSKDTPSDKSTDTTKKRSRKNVEIETEEPGSELVDDSKDHQLKQVKESSDIHANKKSKITTSKTKIITKKPENSLLPLIVVRAKDPAPEKEASSQPKNVASRYDPNMVLGTANYSFDENDRNTLLELVLMVLSRHSGSVRILFCHVSRADVDVSSTLFQFVLVILQMLLGEQNIKTGHLLVLFAKNHNLDFKHSNVKMALREISDAILPSQIIPSPNVKLILYDQDEPVEITNLKNCDYATIRPSEIIPCRKHLSIPGVIFDKIDEKTQFIRSRIFKTDGLMMCVQLTRIDPDGSFDESPIKFLSSDYRIYGFIAYNSAKSKTYASFRDCNDPSQNFILTNGAHRHIPLTETSLKALEIGLMTQSVLLFFVPKSVTLLQLPIYSQVPRKLIGELKKRSSVKTSSDSINKK